MIELIAKLLEKAENLTGISGEKIKLENVATAYKVVAFSVEDGMLEMVPNAEDVINIDKGND